MARTDNLTNFLTDVASAIKTKKGDNTPILASNFDTEIENLPSGGESDYNALVSLTSTNKNSTYGIMGYLIEVPLIVTSQRTTFNKFFSGCEQLTNVPLIDTSNSTDFSYMFYNCKSLTEIPLINTSKGTNFSFMFDQCTSLTIIPQIDTSKGINFTYMFRNCTSLINIPQIDTSNGTSFANMFDQCSSLVQIPILDISNGTSASAMFRNCTSLEEADFSEYNFVKMTGNYTNDNFMENCTSLIKVILPESLTNINNNFFRNCQSLVTIIINNATPPTLNSNAFYMVPLKFTIYVPDEAVETYKAASVWSNHATRIKGISEYNGE